MSIRSLLMPVVSRRLLSPQRLLRQRARAEASRLARCEPHHVHYFHQADDPYSALVAGILPGLVSRYEIALVPHVVGPPPDSAAPARSQLIEYSRVDAQRLATHWGLGFRDPGKQPGPAAIERVEGQLVAAIGPGRFAEVAGPLSKALWDDGAADPGTAPLPPADRAAVQAHRSASSALRQKLGHYLGATFFYAGEWYWGLDRLHHLEQRLQDLGAQRAGVTGPMFAPAADLREAHAAAEVSPIDFFFSLRSPYSAIVAPRVFELGRFTGVPVRLRFVLPMVMRGLAVPREKRRYISLDAAREARLRGMPFGCVNDPVGRPAERGLALIPAAQRHGLGQAYVLSFMRGVWAEGIDAGSDRGLRRIAERAGLAWADAQAALADDSWRATAESNRQALFALGLWGVPSFQVRDLAVWGQDRLWAIQAALVGQATGARRP